MLSYELPAVKYMQMGRGRERRQVDREEVEGSLNRRMKYEDGLRVEREVICGLMQPAVSQKLFNTVSGGLRFVYRRIKK